MYSAISESVYSNLFPQGSKPGILYGLPKFHKISCTTRPIMSAIGTFKYSLANVLVPVLQTLLLIVNILFTVLFIC